MTLYETLGVPNAATMDEIHAAYLKCARVNHPDLQGADIELFSRVKDAHDILFDPQKRAVYDQTGLVVGNPEHTEDLQALNMIAAMLAQAIGSSGEDADFIEAVRSNIRDAWDGKNTEIRKAENSVERMERTASNIESRWKGAETAKRIAVTHARGIAEHGKGEIARLRAEVRIHERAMQLLEGGEYECPASVISKVSINEMLAMYTARQGRPFGSWEK